MPTRDQVNTATYNAVQDELRDKRRDAAPWPDRAMGPDDGAGYNFSGDSIRGFVKGSYKRVRADPTILPVADKVRSPANLPIDDLLGYKVSEVAAWMKSAVCKQLDL